MGHDDAASLLKVLSGLSLPQGDGYIWIAAETRVTKALKAHVLQTLGHPAGWMRGGGYWRHGAREALG